ncbi:MAG TPA: site-specific DNA-methyltransferase, partial [Thermoanaerobaculia bacterium]|nr:site-specific DNA-methyltransferase [Thermoanaerobaculia bacterium]
MNMRKITAEDPITRSPDVLAENVERLQELFPEAFTEGQLDFEVLKQLLGGVVDEREEKYGLNWHGKRRARELALTPSTGTLRPCPEESVDWETTQNLMIEGDNLEVLKLLQKSYAGKVKLIYIDPPYNTGKDFVYPDNFQDNIRNYLELTGQLNGEAKISSNTEASGRFHTDWLNMMYPRIRLARNLLSSDGVIFVSIDDHEVDNLRHLTSELFGPENFLACICWERADSPRMDADYFSTKHDYIVCFAKNAERFEVRRRSYKSENIPKHFSKLDETGRRYYLKPLRAMGGQGETRAARPNLYYAIPAPDGISIYPKLEGGGDGAWRWSKRKLEEESRRIEWVKQGDNWTPYYRIYADESSGKPPETMWFCEDVGSTRNATAEVKGLFDGVKCFDTPKPVALLKEILAISTAPTDIVLDFFAGSGTTGHAVMEHNAADGGTRRYILVQLPEELVTGNKDQETGAEYCDRLGKPRNIAELTKERLRRAARKVGCENPMFVGDRGFRVFRLSSTNIHEWDPDHDNLDQTLLNSVEHLKQGRTRQDVLYELVLKLGIDLCVPIETRTITGKEVHAVGGGILMACLTESIGEDDVEPLALGIVEWHEALNP